MTFDLLNQTKCTPVCLCGTEPHYVNKNVFTFQVALLLVVLVVPNLHIVRAGIDENIAFLLMGFGIILSDDRMEVVRIVTFYTWLLEGVWG